MDEPILLDLGEWVRKEISADQLLARLVDVVKEYLQADRATIYLMDAPKDELVSVAAHLPELKELRVPISQGVAGYVARTQRIVNIPYCETDSRFWSGVDERTGYTTRSMLAAPIPSPDQQLIGIVQCLNKKDGEIFTGEDEDLLSSLAKQIGEVIQETTLGDTPGIQLDSAYQDPETQDDWLPLEDRINRVIGFGPAMRNVFQSIRRVASTKATVLLRGESGTGKSLIARALHYNSAESHGPFVHLDCTTLPEGLMENELFGHERGAYTGAHARKIGKVEAASGGTLFLDEIGDLPLQLQGKLLTLLQERTYHRVGGTKPLKADIRIIAATNRELEQLVEQERFRKDLYYRLQVVQIELPPLRVRGKSDLTRLIHYFLHKAAKHHGKPTSTLTPQALQRLLEYPWPGNVRELENCLESAVIFSDGEIDPQHLPLAQNPPPQPPSPTTEAAATTSSPAQIFAQEPTLKELEGQFIAFLLQQYDGNRSTCARILNIGRNTLVRKIKEHQLDDL